MLVTAVQLFGVYHRCAVHAAEELALRLGAHPQHATIALPLLRAVGGLPGSVNHSSSTREQAWASEARFCCNRHLFVCKTNKRINKPNHTINRLSSCTTLQEIKQSSWCVKVESLRTGSKIP